MIQGVGNIGTQVHKQGACRPKDGLELIQVQMEDIYVHLRPFHDLNSSIFMLLTHLNWGRKYKL